ncbi:MAG: S8 family serine peptidase [Pseudohongiellaceae bacterium]
MNYIWHPPVKQMQHTLIALLCILPLTLASCGSGGGGSAPTPTPTPPPPPPPPPPVLADCVALADGSCDTPDDFLAARDELASRKIAAREYSLQPTLVLANVPQAHAAVELTRGTAAPGTGVRISILDTGLDNSHFMFDGVNIALTLWEGTTSDRVHGTLVASVAVGTRITDPSATITPGSTSATLKYTGVAPGAAVELYAVPIGESFDNAAAITAGLNNSPHFMNLSYGIPYIFVENYNAEEVRRMFFPSISVMRQTGVANPTVFVFSAGNDHRDPCDPTEEDIENCIPNADVMEGGRYDATSPSTDAALPVHITELRDRVVTVVAVALNGDIASFSNRCGVAGPWCIAAPGTGFRVARFSGVTDDPIVGYGQGTSLSAPLVTGGLAMMRQFFRGQLSNTQLLARLYATANKQGKYADMEIYGQGLVDFGAAMSPVGTPLIQRRAITQSNDYSYSVDETRLHLGSAFGDSVTNSLAGHEVAAFDNLGAPFWYKLTSLINTNGLSLQAPSQSPSQLPSQPSSRSSQPAYLRLWNFPFPEFPNTQTTNKNPAATRTKYITTFTQDELSVAHGNWQFGLHQQLLTARSSLLNITGETMALTYALSPGSEWQLTTFTDTKRGKWLQQLEQQYRLEQHPLERQRLSGTQHQSEQQHRLEWQRQSEHWHRLKQWHQSAQHQLAQQYQSSWHQSAQQRRQERHQPERGAVLSWRPHNSTLGLRMGVLGESAGLLGSYTRGAFGKVATTSTVAGFEWSSTWHNWQIAADVELGMAQTNTQGGLLSKLSKVATSAASLYARRALNNKNSVMFSLSQPARVEQGELLLRVPIGQTLTGELLQQNITAQLRPSGRQLDLTAHWHHNNLWGGQLRLGTIYSHHLGHIAGASDYGMLLNWQAAF